MDIYIGEFSYLGFWASSKSRNWNVFNCYLLNKHPPIRLHEKTVQVWGEFGRNSPKIKRGKFENSFVFSENFGYFSQIFPKLEQFFHAVFGGCLFNRYQFKTVQFWEEN